MNCWICGDIATTKEHFFKASNLRKLNPHQGQKTPLYFHSFKPNPTKNISFGSAKSSLLTSKTEICAHCNNVRTQPHDIAWDNAFDLFVNHWKGIEITRTIYLKRAFGRNRKAASKSMSLYFHKLMGCALLDAKMTPAHINIAVLLADAVRFGRPLKALHLSVFKTSELYGAAQIGISDLSIIYDRLTTEIARAEWHYLCGEFGIRVIYVAPSTPEFIPCQSWDGCGKKYTIRLMSMAT